MNKISIIEMDLISIWPCSNTANGCRALIKTLGLMESEAINSGFPEDAQMINDARELVFTKGNIILANELH